MTRKISPALQRILDPKYTIDNPLDACIHYTYKHGIKGEADRAAMQLEAILAAGKAMKERLQVWHEVYDEITNDTKAISAWEKAVKGEQKG